MPSALNPPQTNRRERLRRLASAWHVPVADRAVCEGHSAPLDFLAAWLHDRPSLSVVHGPRGGGKSYLAALATHIESLRYPGHGTRILGGSLAQSQQIYTALSEFDVANPGTISNFTKTFAAYGNGSDVSILAASSTSVRGPHVPTLRLDEVDEIDNDIRDAAAGMCMARDGVAASVSMTSTWHNLAGPMGVLRERSLAGEFPWFTFCAFEILERCPDERSGPALENCPHCPLVKWCHADISRAGVPKAKRSRGHYAIESLIQKTKLVSGRVFESDYLCVGPRAAGVWFETFEPSRHVTAKAEYDPALSVIVSVDSGVFTGAVWFQVWTNGRDVRVNVFGDYLNEGGSAEVNARAIIERGRQLCNDRRDRVFTDPSGASRNAVGPIVTAEYERAGLRGGNGRLEHWPTMPVRAGLDLIDALLLSADGTVSLTVHPRCRDLINAFGSYRRAKVAGQWRDYPEDPNHPAEDVMDPLRSGLLGIMPEGRKPQPKLRRVHASALL